MIHTHLNYCDIICRADGKTLGDGMYVCCYECDRYPACEFATCNNDHKSCAHKHSMLDDKALREKLCLDLWGADFLRKKTVEELTELSLAIQHFDAGKVPLDAVIEELADVGIMISQMESMLRSCGRAKEFDQIKEAKLSKLKGLIAEAVKSNSSGNNS